MTTSINKWKDKLLDLGKRNRLISFKDSKTGTIEAVLPDFEATFNKISNDAGVVEIFDSDNYFGNQIGDDGRISKNEFINALSGKLKSSQIALFNKDFSTIRVIKHLYKKSKEALNEKGINILYLAFGFIRWFESENSNIPYYAPLLLVPVKIAIESATTPIKIDYMKTKF